MLDKDLLKSLEILDKLEGDDVIENYSYNSKEGEFKFTAKIGGEFGDTREETLGYYDVTEEKILNFIEEWEREFKKMVEEAEEEERGYQRDRDEAYWAVQGVEY